MTDTDNSTSASTADPERAARLLEASNSASAHVGVLHVAFMALCAYVLVIVFGTTDLDLLMGKDVKLPVVDVQVPIAGFYAFAPYLVVLVHFNLLLQLQLLSRKLYAFDAAAPAEEGIGGLRDQLHIFPYTYYLIGRPSPIVRRLLGAVVTITLLLMPLSTLLAVQLRFLAYQSELVTWAQRFATWSDVALVIALWPVIMDREDHWRGYMRRMNQRLRAVWPRTLVWGLVWVGFVICWFTESVDVFVRAASSVAALIAFLALARLVAILWRRLRKSARSNGVSNQRGVPWLLFVLALGSGMPMMLLAHGEAAQAVVRSVLPTWFFTIESQVRSDQETPASRLPSRLLAAQCRLDLKEQVLLAKEAKPEIVANLRADSGDAREQALRQIEPIILKYRSLRGANFSEALLSRAHLRGAQLQDANLWEAKLQGANLWEAQLQGAYLREAQLQGANLLQAELQGANLGNAQLQGANLQDAKLKSANLREAQLQGANLKVAKLQGANLSDAKLQGADLSTAHLQGADLTKAQLQGANVLGAHLQGANLWEAQLQGADLREAELQGANLWGANLQGAELRGAALYGVTFRGADVDYVQDTSFLDIRGVSWKPLPPDQITGLEKMVANAITYDKRREEVEEVLERLRRAGKPGETPRKWESCLRDERTAQEITCKQEWCTAELAAFRAALHPVLVSLACESTAAAKGFIRQVDRALDQDHEDSTRRGLAQKLAARINDRACLGLYTLTPADKDTLVILAKRDAVGATAPQSQGRRR